MRRYVYTMVVLVICLVLGGCARHDYRNDDGRYGHATAVLDRTDAVNQMIAGGTNREQAIQATSEQWNREHPGYYVSDIDVRTDGRVIFKTRRIN